MEDDFFFFEGMAGIEFGNRRKCMCLVAEMGGNLLCEISADYTRNKPVN